MHYQDFDPSGAGRVFKTEDVFQAVADPGNNHTSQATHSAQTQFQQPELNQSLSPPSDVNESQRSHLQKHLWP